MGAADISNGGMILAFSALIIPFAIFMILGIDLYKETLISVIRMSVQLFLVGFYLTVIFDYNSPFINCGYILLMLCAASYSLIRNSGLKMTMFSHVFPALLIAITTVLLFYSFAVFENDPFYDAPYFVPVAGMLLGNSMSRTIVTLERFYSSIKSDNDGFTASVIMGGSITEASRPYLRTAYKAGILPYLAGVATTGIVALPGMMTGQMLGGTVPSIAVKYQIAILLAILAATELSTILTIIFSLRKGFNAMGFLNEAIFKPKKGSSK